MLKNKVCVKNEGITQDIFDAMVAVAKASGFDFSIQSNSCVGDYSLGYIGVDKGRAPMLALDQKDAVLGYYTIISLEDWLFSLAPIWADRVEKWDGAYYYANANHCNTLGKSDYIRKTEDDLDVSPVEIIATFKQEEWAPKVGEKCFWWEYQVTPMLLEPDCGGDIIIELDGEYRAIKPKELKQHERYTEQELLAYEVYRIMSNGYPMHLEFFIDNMSEEKEKYLRLVESGRFK